MNYYNEIDKYCVQWLENLMSEGLIPKGEVDDRSIIDVQPSDLKGYTQCHFFAGLGGWPRALELAAWPPSEHVWTGSCPCQPLSSAGQRKGHADERHLWPAFYRIIAECEPSVVFGEQVASKLGREWFSGVRADLEALGYAVGAADLCAASVGAPHIRQRLWFVAAESNGTSQYDGTIDAEMAFASESMADANSTQSSSRRRESGEVFSSSQEPGWAEHGPSLSGRSGGARGNHVADANSNGHGRGRAVQMGRLGSAGEAQDNGFAGATQWSTESCVRIVAHGVPARVAKLRALGNAIVPQVAAEFIKASMEAIS